MGDHPSCTAGRGGTTENRADRRPGRRSPATRARPGEPPMILLLDVLDTLVHDPYRVELPAFLGLDYDGEGRAGDAIDAVIGR